MPFAIILFFVLVICALLLMWHKGGKPTHAGGIVYKNKNGRTLFLVVTSASNKNKWVLPKGRIEKNETPEFAAIREVMEETGVAAKPIKKAGIVGHTKKGRRIVVVYFLMEFERFYDTSTEDRKVEWLEKDAAVDRLSFVKTKNILRGV